jgi:hypothetical protein
MPDDQLPSLRATINAALAQAHAQVTFPPPFTFIELRLSDPGHEVRPEPPTPSETPQSLSPEEVWAGWTQGGTAWLNGLKRRDIRAVATAFQSPHWISSIHTKMPLFKALWLKERWPRIRGARRRRLFTSVWFSLAPPTPDVEATFKKGESPPRWWRDMAESMSTGTHAEWLGEQLMGLIRTHPTEGRLRISLTALELTDAVMLGPWHSTIIKKIALHSFDDTKRLIFLADKGASRGPGDTVHRATHIAICKVVKFGEDQGNESKRPEVADLLQKRLGPIFGTEVGRGWQVAANAHQKVRRWLMGQVLDIIFVHLSPPGGDFRHQLEPRRQFWRDQRFIRRMQKVFILAGNEFNTALDTQDIVDLLERFPNAISRRDLNGTPNQAIVWMHWLAPNGTWWTLIEGNQNCKVRIRRGIYHPPRRHLHGELQPVNYSASIVHGELSDKNPHAEQRLGHADFTVAHHGNGWTDHTLNFMRANGIVL